MSLDYVARGDGIKASTVNSLIDAVQGGGNMSPDFLVTGTRTGPQIVASAKLGSSSLSRNCVFDIDNYILSGWPMAKVKLGSTLQNALDAVRVHTDDGIQNATSAVLVFKNSSNCPFGGGTLSGCLLTESDFGVEAAYGDTGWVKTKMEGVFGQTQPNLQVWKTEDNVIEVIGNVDSDEAKSELSALLSQGGMQASDLSTLKILEEFPLVVQESLQVGASSKPASRVTMKNGIVDVYSYGTEKNQRVMLKAFLACYKVEDGQEGRKDSHWTWLIPMGPGSEYENDVEGVWTTQFTYGGDPIIVECEEGSLSSGFNGDPTWIEQSEFGNQLIAFGKFDSDGGDEIEPGTVWIDLEYKYEKFAVVGTLNDGSSEVPTGDSVLGHSIRVAQAGSYTPKDDVVTGFEVHPSYVFNGTVGDLFKGEPKLDSYTPFNSQSRYRSLEWTNRGEDDQGQQIGAVTCRCMQLYGFDTASESQPTSADLYLARRFDSETSSAALVYVPISSMGDIPPDSEISDAQTSSLQWRTLVSADISSEQYEEVSTDIRVLQAWNFDNLSDVYNDLCIALSGQQQHVMLRNCQTSAVEYLQLSCLSVLTDSQGMTDQKSIDWLSSDTMAPLELQLYGFDVGEAESPTSADLYLARRMTETGPVLTYIPLSTLSDPPDSVVSSGLSSIQFVNVLEETSQEGEESETSSNAKAISLFNFGETDKFYKSLSGAQLSGYEQHVVLRNASISAVEYLQLSALSVLVDSQGMLGQKSVSWLSSDGAAGQLLQLWNFDQEGETGLSIGIGPQPTSLLSDDSEFLIRKGGAGGELQYVKVDAFAAASDADSQIEDSHTSSLQYREVSSDNDDVSGFFQIWEFDHFDKRWWELSDALSGANRDILLRDCETSSVCYLALSALSSAPAIVDSEGQTGQKSISWLSADNDDPRLQLYKMNEAGESLSDVTLSARPSNILPLNYEFVLRKGGAGGEISYASLKLATANGNQCDGDEELAQTSSLQTRELSSAEGVSAVMQIWEFDHFDKRWTMLSDALSGENKDVLLRDCETSSVCYLSLSALSGENVHLDSEGESGQKSIDWLSGSDPAEMQLYKMDQEGEVLSTVVLGETAVSLLPENYEFVVRKNGAGGEIGYATVDASSLSSASSRFQFGISINSTTAVIGEGAVQIGGYTYFSNGGSVSNIASGTHYICVRCTMGYQAPAIDFVEYSTTQALNSAQGDLTRYIFPIYKIVNGEIAVDYRPMPNAGCWEVAESQNGGN